MVSKPIILNASVALTDFSFNYLVHSGGFSHRMFYSCWHWENTYREKRMCYGFLCRLKVFFPLFVHRSLMHTRLRVATLLLLNWYLTKLGYFLFCLIGALGNWWIGRWNVYATKRWQKVICGIGVRSNSHFEGELVVIRAPKICIKCIKHGRSYFYETSSDVCFNLFWSQNWQSPHLYVNQLFSANFRMCRNSISV